MRRSHKVIIHLAGPSCVGKSTVAEELNKHIENLYLVSFDKLKWQLAGYNRDKHNQIIRQIALGVFETVCEMGLPIQIDYGFKNKSQFSKYKSIAKKHGYRFVFVQLNADEKELVRRYKKRLERVKKSGAKLSVTNVALFKEVIKKVYFAPKPELSFNTSNVTKEHIAECILDILSQKAKQRNR